MAEVSHFSNKADEVTVPPTLPTERSTAVLPATKVVPGVENSVGERLADVEPVTRNRTSKFEVVTNAVVTISERPELGIVGMGVGVSEKLVAANAIPDETVAMRGEENRRCWGRRSSPRSRRSSKTRYCFGGHETPKRSTYLRHQIRKFLFIANLEDQAKHLVSLILFNSARRLVHCFSVHCRFVQIYASRGCPNHCSLTHVEAFDRLPARR